MSNAFSALLQEHFGHKDFRSGQEKIITLILEGKNALALFPTGGGKSLCYQLPALILDGPVIVISPLLALMRDQVTGLLQNGIPAVRLDSTLDENELDAALTDINSSTARIVFLSPERLSDPSTLTLLKEQSPSLVAIDEAHCFSAWGQSFRPDYRRLPSLIKKLKPRSILALTATATRPVMRDISKGFKIPAAHRIKLSYIRPNLSWHISYAQSLDFKKDQLFQLLKEGSFPAIVYCTRQITTESIAAFLKRNSINARAFHAGLTSELRADLLTSYMNNEINVIVATIAFGMGVDKSNVRNVIHFDLPRTPEGWIQEAGRAGRDGLPANTHVIANQQDVIHHQNITKASQPSDTAIERIIHSIFTSEKTVALSPYALTTSLDVSRQVYDTIVTYLEADGMLLFQDIIHRKVRITPTRRLHANAPDILKIRGWIDLFDHVDNLTQHKNLYTKIKESELLGDIILQPSHQLHIYTVKKQPDDLKESVARFSAHFAEATTRELNKLDSVIKILTSRRCVQTALLDHLDEKRVPPCGRCSRCLKHPLKSKIPGKPALNISDEDNELIRQLGLAPPSQLTTPLQLTRFLLGIGSPASRAARLTRRDEYGLLEGAVWEDVYALCQAVL